jgi:hypothetical protein
MLSLACSSPALVSDCYLINLDIEVKVENEQGSPITDAQITMYSEESSAPCPQGEKFNFVGNTDKHGSLYVGSLKTSPRHTLHIQIIAEEYEIYEYNTDASYVSLEEWLFVLKNVEN